MTECPATFRVSTSSRLSSSVAGNLTVGNVLFTPTAASVLDVRPRDLLLFTSAAASLLAARLRHVLPLFLCGVLPFRRVHLLADFLVGVATG